MADIAFVMKNLLEDATVTVTNDPDTGFSEARLYDRQVSLFWKWTGTGAITFHVDQGAADILDADFLAIFRHNFSGEDLTWEYSDDDTAWSAAVSGWTQGDNDQIIKTLSAAVTHQYWRVTLSSMTNPRCGEIWMGEQWTHEILANPAPRAHKSGNVRWNKTVGGLNRSTKFGEAIRVRSYEMALSAAELSAFQSALADLDERSLPFYFCDHANAWFLARFTDQPREIYSNKTHTWVQVSVEEVL